MGYRSLLHQVANMALILLFLIGCSTPKATPVQTGQHAHTLGEGDQPLHYLLFLPQDYEKKPQKKWPLILFLHGAGERGDVLEDLERVKKYGPPMLVEEQLDFPFIVVSPQCPVDSSWDAQHDGLDALLDEVVTAYAVDTDRMYVTGLSMGGFGTWQLALRHPERFAAIVPIAGGYRFRSDFVPENICDLRHLPVWAFHGAQDTIVRPKQSEVVVNALEACGGNIRFTLYPYAEHDSWTKTYSNPELFAWLLQHTK